MTEPTYLTRDQSRRIDQLAIERLGIAGVVLMENAGRGVVDVLFEIDRQLADASAAPPLGGPGGAVRASAAILSESRGSSPRSAAPVVILCGKGNNAGDGFVIARHLAIRGVPATSLCLGAPHELTSDARINYAAAVACGLQIIDLSRECSSAALIAQLDSHSPGARWIVDALLGTGAQGEPREPLATAIRWMNAHPARRLAVDLPSGLDCDTGAAASATVRADVTCTFVAPKAGFANPTAASRVGLVRVVSIGLPSSAIQELLAR